MTATIELFHILSVEDNPGDRMLIEKFFSPNFDNFKLHFAWDGKDALDFLYKKGKFTNAVRPHLILLDLNLPRKDGREVLLEVKQDPELKDIPVVVFTTSKSMEDKQMSLSLGAEQFFSKPSDLHALRATFDSIRHWFMNRKT